MTLGNFYTILGSLVLFPLLACNQDATLASPDEPSDTLAANSSSAAAIGPLPLPASSATADTIYVPLPTSSTSKVDTLYIPVLPSSSSALPGSSQALASSSTVPPLASSSSVKLSSSSQQIPYSSSATISSSSAKVSSSSIARSSSSSRAYSSSSRISASSSSTGGSEKLITVTSAIADAAVLEVDVSYTVTHSCPAGVAFKKDWDAADQGAISVTVNGETISGSYILISSVPSPFTLIANKTNTKVICL